MNYEKLYINSMRSFKLTSPRERLLKRNNGDLRLNDSVLYTEVHHITPRSLGGSNENSNLVELLPEEHLFAHFLRYKAYNKREDMFAVTFMLNGYSRRSVSNSINVMTKKARLYYAFVKQNSFKIKKEQGWLPEEALKRISFHRKNKVVLRNTETLECRDFDKNSEEFLKLDRNIWIHPTKGTVTVKTKSGKHIRIPREEYLKGGYEPSVKAMKERNSSWSGISNEEILEKWIEESNKLGYIPRYLSFRNSMYPKFPKTLSKSRKILLEQIKEKCPNLEVKRYWSKELRQKMSTISSGKRWVNKNGEAKVISLEDLDLCISLGWNRGKGTEIKNKVVIKKPKRWVNKNGQIKRIDSKDLNIYVDLGWSVGTKNKIK